MFEAGGGFLECLCEFSMRQTFYCGGFCDEHISRPKWREIPSMAFRFSLYSFVLPLIQLIESESRSVDICMEVKIKEC